MIDKTCKIHVHVHVHVLVVITLALQFEDFTLKNCVYFSSLRNFGIGRQSPIGGPKMYPFRETSADWGAVSELVRVPLLTGYFIHGSTISMFLQNCLRRFTISGIHVHFPK